MSTGSACTGGMLQNVRAEITIEHAPKAGRPIPGESGVTPPLGLARRNGLRPVTFITVDHWSGLRCHWRPTGVVVSDHSSVPRAAVVMRLLPSWILGRSHRRIPRPTDGWNIHGERRRVRCVPRAALEAPPRVGTTTRTNRCCAAKIVHR
jgi:hypothetical protein